MESGNKQTIYGKYTQLYIPCRYGYLEIVTLLCNIELIFKDSVNKVDSLGHTPLFIACNYNHLKIAEYLLYKGVNVDRRTEKLSIKMINEFTSSLNIRLFVNVIEYSYISYYKIELDLFI